MELICKKQNKRQMVLKVTHELYNASPEASAWIDFIMISNKIAKQKT